MFIYIRLCYAIAHLRLFIHNYLHPKPLASMGSMPSVMNATSNNLFFCTSYPQRKHYSPFVSPTEYLLRKHFRSFGIKELNRSVTSSFTATYRQERPQITPLARFILCFLFYGSEEMRLWHKNECKHSLWDCPHNECTLSTLSKYTSGHISTVDTSELQKISGLNLIFSCQMLKDTTQKTASISSDLWSTPSAFTHLGWHSDHLTFDAKAIRGV